MILFAAIAPLCIAVNVYSFIIFIRVILSWFPQLPDGVRPITDLIYAITEPVLRWARPLIPPLRIGMVALDLSILLVFLILRLLAAAVC